MIVINLSDRANILDRISEWADLQVNNLEEEPFSTAGIMGDTPMMLVFQRDGFAKSSEGIF